MLRRRKSSGLKFEIGGEMQPEMRSPGPSAVRPRGVNTKPDPLWLGLLGLLFVAVAILTWLGGEMLNYVAGIVGLFGSVVLLGMARSKESKLRASGRFSEWRVRSTTITMVLFLCAWSVGIANVFFVAKEWTRG